MPRGRSKLWYESFPGGMRTDLNPAVIPAGEWLYSKNVIVRKGRTLIRPGYSDTALSTPGDGVYGLYCDGVTSDGANAWVAHTKTKAIFFDGTDITGSWTSTLGAYAPIQMIRFRSGSTNYYLRTNSANAVDKWDGNTANDFVDATGAPAGSDLTAVGPYCIVASATDASVSWCDANDIDSWTASNVIYFNEARTQGFIPVAVRALNNQSFALYTQGTIHVCQLQAAKAAFQVQFVGYFPGPLHASALVAHQGVHYWMGWDYSLWAFDGASVRRVSAPMNSAFVRAHIAYTYGSYACITGLEDPEYWLSLSQPANSLADLWSVNIRTGKVFYHRTAHYFHAMAPYLGNIDRTAGITQNFLGGTSDGKIMQFSDSYTSDNGTAIAWEFGHGFRPATGDVDERGEIDVVTSYWKKTSSSCTVTIGLTVSDSISDDESETTGTFDTQTATTNHLTTFRGKRGKWVKLRHSGTAAVAGIEFRGAAVTSWGRAMV